MLDCYKMQIVQLKFIYLYYFKYYQYWNPKITKMNRYKLIKKKCKICQQSTWSRFRSDAQLTLNQLIKAKH